MIMIKKYICLLVIFLSMLKITFTPKTLLNTRLDMHELKLHDLFHFTTKGYDKKGLCNSHYSTERFIYTPYPKLRPSYVVNCRIYLAERCYHNRHMLTRRNLTQMCSI